MTRLISRMILPIAYVLLVVQTGLIGLDFLLPSSWTGPFDELISWAINAALVWLIARKQKAEENV